MSIEFELPHLVIRIGDGLFILVGECLTLLPPYIENLFSLLL